jgi:flavin reductase (DIM6/NTAB) family NADH-FMN oxidoreductase RutF
MFYETARNDHGLPHDPFKAIVGPRPIGWISTVDREGRVNLAPYSFFNAVCSRPPMVVFSSEGRKDSVANIIATGEFVCSLATLDLAQAMNVTSAPLPHGENEMAHAGLAAAPSRLVRPPRVAASPVALECRAVKVEEISDLSGTPLDRWLVLGQVVGIHIDERFIVNGKLDTAAMKPIARLGYMDYAVVDRTFTLQRPPGG